MESSAVFPRGLELVPGPPAGKFPRLGGFQPHEEEEPGIIQGASEVPGLVVLVGRLVVLRALPLLDPLLAPALGASHEVDAAVEVHAGHADPREAELVRAVEEAAVGELVPLDDATLPARHG